MTAIVVLTILSVIIFQIIRSVTIATHQSSKRLDLYQEAAFVLDRIASDLQNRSRRADQPFVISGTEAGLSMNNAYLEFYTNAPAYYPDSGNNAGTDPRYKLSKIAYRIQDNDPNNSANTNIPPQLQRAVIPLYWTSGSKPVFQVATSPSNPTVEATDPNWQTLSRNVICLKITCLPRNSGTLTTSLTAATPDPNNPLPQNPATQNIAAINVAIALLDDNTLKILGNGNEMTKAVEILRDETDPSASQNDYVQAWNKQLSNPNLNPLVRQNLRFAQRLIPLN